MANFWLSDDDSNTLDLDENVTEISMGSMKRSFSIIDNMGTNGGTIRGFGTFKSRTFEVSRRDYATGSETNFVNDTRDNFLKFFTAQRTKNIYFNVRSADDTKTYRTKVYTTDIGADKFNYITINESKSFKLISPTGIFYDITETTDTTSISANVEETISLSVNGTIESPLICEFVPDTNCSLFQVIRNDDFGFRLQGDFTAGQKIAFNTATNELSIAGVLQKTSQFLTGGSLFNLFADTTELYVLADQDGDFSYRYNARYI
jgi:hypothetical protein